MPLGGFWDWITGGTSGVEVVVGVVGSVMAAMLANPLLIFFFSASVLGVGIGVFKRLRRAAH
jgi:hypothetical protein